MTVDEFREAMDGDKEFQSKRRALVFVSLLLLALVVSGAEIKEANTFIFKIEFSNHIGLSYLLVLSVLACMLRYYSYSERYRNKLFEIWSRKLLDDFSIYYVDQESGGLSGMLGDRIGIYIGDYDVEHPKYKKNGFLKRSVGLRTTEVHEFHGEVYCTKYFDLNKYDNAWTPKKFRRFLFVEFKYRAEAWVKYRETLDLTSPYLLGFSSLLAFFVDLFMS